MTKYIMLFWVALVIAGCKKEMKNPCVAFPCDYVGEDKIVTYNRVAYDPGFRIGRWKDVRKSSNNQSDLIFHTDSIFSWGSIHNAKYDFQGLNFRAYQNFAGDMLPTNHPMVKQTYYNDTTGVLIVKTNEWSVDYFIKIE